MMTIQQLYEKLKSPAFQNTTNTDLFYNVYVYQYDAHEEYDIRRQISEFKESLARPSTFVDVLVLNLFDEFCTWLDNMPFGRLNPSMLEYIFKKGEKDNGTVFKTLTARANSDEFFAYLHQRIMNFKSEQNGLKKPYVFMHGFGQMYPFLRTNSFLTKYEPYNRVNEYKIIVFYPGHRVGNTFSLFDCMDDAHTYRATLLLNE